MYNGIDHWSAILSNGPDILLQLSDLQLKFTGRVVRLPAVLGSNPIYATVMYNVQLSALTGSKGSMINSILISLLQSISLV